VYRNGDSVNLGLKVVSISSYREVGYGDVDVSERTSQCYDVDISCLERLVAHRLVRSVIETTLFGCLHLEGKLCMFHLRSIWYHIAMSGRSRRYWPHISCTSVTPYGSTVFEAAGSISK